MPPLPTFDHYKELEVDPSASLAEITSSYRRLARVHHPDRNRGNEEGATVRFQRLQQAYETLSDPIKRNNYDVFVNTDRAYEESNYDSDEFDLDEFYESAGFGAYEWHNYQRSSAWEEFEREMERREQRAREREAEYWAQYQARRSHLNEQRVWRRRREQELKAEREAQRTAEREAQRAAKQAAEDALIAAKERQKEEEKQHQEQRWMDKNAISKDERLATCLHSDFCAKVEQKKKFKCGACAAKRGMTAFECPHCSVFLCQLCVTNFSNRRQKLAKIEKYTPSSPAQESHDYKETATSSHKNINPNTKPQADTTQQPSSQQNNKGKKKKKKSTKKSEPVDDDTAQPTEAKSLSKLPAESVTPDADASDKLKSPFNVDTVENMSTCPVFSVSNADVLESPMTKRSDTANADHDSKSDSAPVDNKNTSKPSSPKHQDHHDLPNDHNKENINPKAKVSQSHAAQADNRPAANKPQHLAPQVIQHTNLEAEDSTATSKEKFNTIANKKIDSLPTQEQVKQPHGLMTKCPQPDTKNDKEQTGIVKDALHAKSSREEPSQKEASDTQDFNPVVSQMEALRAESTMKETDSAHAKPNMSTADHGVTKGVHGQHKTSSKPDTIPQDSQSENSQPPQQFLNTTHPDPGAVHAFVKILKLNQGIPVQLLRSAMQRFGDVISIKRKKSPGAACVSFGDHEALCRAMAASPVALDHKISVSVTEAKFCGNCGKLGHLTADCTALCVEKEV